MRTTLITLVSLLTIVAMAGDALAQEEQDASRGRDGLAAPVEFSDLEDKEATIPGGPLAPDPLQILYTNPIDAVGPPFPIDSKDISNAVPTDEQVDALANRGDAYYSSVKNNRAELLVSFEGDDDWRPAAPDFQNAVFGETILGRVGLLWKQADLYNPNPGPPPDEIEDLDGLELWGPWSNGTSERSGWDANVFSVAGDPMIWGAAQPISVWTQPTWAGPVVPLVTRAQIFAAVTTVPWNPFAGTEEEIDVDALMCSVWEEEIIFSIRAASNWDGGELVVYNWGTGASNYLFHGMHFWDTAHLIAPKFLVGTEEVDAIEGVPRSTEFRHQWWNNPDIHNNTGVVANDLHVVLEGHHKIKHHVAFPFSFEYELLDAPKRTELRWFGHTVNHCEWVHIGWATWGPVRLIDMYWTLDGVRISPIRLIKPRAIRLGDAFHFVMPNVFDPVEGPETIHLYNVRYAVFEEPIPLEDLNAGNSELMDALEPLSDPEEIFDIDPLDELILPPIPIPVPKGWVPVLVFDVIDPGVPEEPFVVDFAETVAAFPTRTIPAVSEWGLVVMTLLVLAAGTIVFRKLRAAAA